MNGYNKEPWFVRTNMAYRNCYDCKIWKKTQPWGYDDYGMWRVEDICKSCIWQRRISDIKVGNLRYKLSEKIFSKWKIEAGIPKMFTTSELVYFAKMKEERKLDAIMKEIHSDGLDQWRSKHHKS